MRAIISRTKWFAALALAASLAAVGPPANALTLAERAPVATDVTRVSITIPASRKSRLERNGTAAYMIKTSARRTSAVLSHRRPVEPAQLLWLGALLTSMCGFALYFGRELTTRFPARRG